MGNSGSFESAGEGLRVMEGEASSDSAALRTVREMPERTFWIVLFGVIMALKSFILLLDHAPMFFLGDSVAYLDTAKWGWIPPDRSFLYGWIIRYISLWMGSLTNLIVVQMVAMAGASLMCAYIVRRYFGGTRAVAVAVGLLCAVEPLQLMYERYVMTESFSLFAFALFTTLALGYLQRPTVMRLALMQAAGVFVIAMRVSYLPMVEVATLLAPVLAAWGVSSGSAFGEALGKKHGVAARRWVRVVAHAALSCALFYGMHGVYKQVYAASIRGYLPNAEPAYYYDNGFHLLCFVAPLVQPGDFPHPEKAAEIFKVDFDLRNPDTRGSQRWAKGGLIANVREAYPDHVEANRLAEMTAWNAVKRDPWGELRLSAYSYGDYWNLEHLRMGLGIDRGSDRELPDELLTMLREDFHIPDGEKLPHIATVTNRYFYAAWPWYLVLMVLPLPALIVIFMVPVRQRPAALLLCVFASLQFAVIAACSISPTVRFLHGSAWMGIIVGGVALTRFIACRRERRGIPAAS